MNTLLPILIAIAVAATFGALALGIISMARGGQFDSRNSNKLMRLRVILQFAAILLIGLAFLFSNK
ncbi:MAG: twin transmembrane helix small protein [Alphaproteobacteria bacterium]